MGATSSAPTTVGLRSCVAESIFNSIVQRIENALQHRLVDMSMDVESYIIIDDVFKARIGLRSSGQTGVGDMTGMTKLLRTRQVRLAIVDRESACELGAMKFSFHEGTTEFFMYLYNDAPEEAYAARSTLLHPETQRIPHEFMRPIISRLDAWIIDLELLRKKLSAQEGKKKKKKNWRTDS